MKTVALFLFSLLVAFSIGFLFPRVYPKIANQLIQPSLVEEGQVGSQFSPAPFPVENRSFVVVIIGRNNGAFVEKTLQSAFFQKYENFRIIYVDDASSDGSFDLVRDLIYDNRSPTQVTLVHNEEPLGHIANLSRAVQACADEEIVVVLHGEDRLAHEWVLERLNQYYADSDLWLTYGQYLEYPSFKKGICLPYVEIEGEEKGFRKTSLVFSHLKTFYASLFKKIEEKDLIYQGKYIAISADCAYMIPLLEMARNHFHFIPEILYLFSSNRKEERELQAKIERQIRGQTAYAPLKSLFTPPANDIEAQGAIEP